MSALLRAFHQAAATGAAGASDLRHGRARRITRGAQRARAACPPEAVGQRGRVWAVPRALRERHGRSFAGRAGRGGCLSRLRLRGGRSRRGGGVRDRASEGDSQGRVTRARGAQRSRRRGATRAATPAGRGRRWSGNRQVLWATFHWRNGSPWSRFGSRSRSIAAKTPSAGCARRRARKRSASVRRTCT